MTVRQFVEWIIEAFPKASFMLHVNASVKHTPAHRNTWFGQTTDHPVRNQHEASYRLNFNRDFFEKDTNDQQFEAPSLEVLQAVLRATFHEDVNIVLNELELL